MRTPSQRGSTRTDVLNVKNVLRAKLKAFYQGSDLEDVIGALAREFVSKLAMHMVYLRINLSYGDKPVYEQTIQTDEPILDNNSHFTNRLMVRDYFPKR